MRTSGFEGKGTEEWNFHLRSLLSAEHKDSQTRRFIDGSVIDDFGFGDF